MKDIISTDRDKLEELIDKAGLSEILLAIAQICSEKAEHVVSTWQDKPLASAWNKAGAAIGRIQANGL